MFKMIYLINYFNINIYDFVLYRMIIGIYSIFYYIKSNFI